MTTDTSPRLALSPVTISQCGFEESFQIAAEAGFKGIGLRYDRMEAYLANGKTIADVKKLSRTFELPFAEAAVQWRPSTHLQAPPHRRDR